MRPPYPFSAVQGQTLLKRALVLCAIDPGIGGVLIRGPRGAAKTTLARALAELVPGPFVELPLGASEERVAGSLDLEAVLSTSRVTFSPGLLAEAHEGVLYVDEVNLLADALVDVVLDAAATGHHRVERDGISQGHPARFVLVGTMNPDEGDLRPQLLDRFGLSAVAEGRLPPRERARIVSLRLAFEADPHTFRQEWAARQRALVDRCRRARERVAGIRFSETILGCIAERCEAADVDGVRADLALARAARAHAAWQGREEIRTEDVEAVASLALDHRSATPDASPPPGPPRASARSTPPAGEPRTTAALDRSDAPDPARHAGLRARDVGARDPAGASRDGGPTTPSALEPVPVRGDPPPPKLPDWLARPAPHVRRPGERRAARAPRDAAPRRPPIDWFRTLARGRPRHRRALVPRAHAPRRRPQLLVLIDCSASMRRGRALAAAKGIARALVDAARRRGRAVTLVSFAGHEACVEATSTRPRQVLRAALADLSSRGGTPLRAALRCAWDLLRRSPPEERHQLVLLTDGRTREPVDDLARALRRRRVDAVVVDCERAAVPLGRCATLARALDARRVASDGSGLVLGNRERNP